MADITFCEYKECPHTDCERHPTKVELEFKKGVPLVSVADFRKICGRLKDDR